MKENNPLVSIIVRTKDRPKLLRRALQSIAVQTYRPIEVVLVNDGGCDLDAAELGGILGNVSLNYVRLEKNTGRAHAGNVGLENAKGEYIGFLDDDDEFYPEHTATLLSVLSEKADLVGAYVDSEIIEREYDAEGNIVNEKNKGIFRSWEFSYEVLLFENYIPLMCCLLRKQVFADTGGFDESLEIFEDWDLFIRAAKEKPFSHIAGVTTKYIHWSKTEQIAFVDWPDARDYYIKVLLKHSDKITPEGIYKYFTFKQEEANAKQKFVDLLSFSQEERTREFQRLKEELKTKESYLEDKQNELQALTMSINNYREEIQQMREELRAKTGYIEEMHGSLGWRALNFYRTRIKKRIFPGGTRREHAYRFLLKGVHAVYVYGLRLTFNKAAGKLRSRLVRKRIKQEKFNLPLIANGITKIVDKKISVIIPTKNAGSEFKSTIEKIKNQKGLRELEFIIIDSGSQDDTLKIAEHFGAKVSCIRPEEFNHGRVRNIAAEISTGDYLVFLSQDAIPISETCIFDMISVLEKDSRTAVAVVKQVPRSDADIFACWQLWYHYNKLLDPLDNQIVHADPDTLSRLSPTDRRKISQIDNVFSCIKRDIFDRFKFRPLPYAEDLDLGLRLIGNGYKIAFLFSIGVIHSHNRNPEYFLRRSYVDTKSISKLLGYEPIQWDELGIHSVEDIMSLVHAFYSRIKFAMGILQGNNLNAPINSLFATVKSSLLEAQIRKGSAGEKSLDDLLERLVSTYQKKAGGYNGKAGVLINQYLDLVDSFGEFLGAFDEISEKEEEFISALYKFFAIVAGSNIGNFAIYLENKNQSDPALTYLENLLSEGV